MRAGFRVRMQGKLAIGVRPFRIGLAGLAGIALGLVTLPIGPAAGSPARGEIDMPNGLPIAAAQARGMECAYQAPNEYDDPRFAWFPGSSPAMVVPPLGTSIYLVTQASASAPSVLVRADARTGKASKVATPTSPSAGPARVCSVVASEDGSSAAVLLIGADGTLQWSIMRLGGAAVPIGALAQGTLTPSAAFTSDGSRLVVVSRPCPTCTGSFAAIAYDAATGAEVAQFPVPIDPTAIASQPDGISLAASESGIVLAAHAPAGLTLWSLSEGLVPLTRRDLPTASGQAAATTPACRPQPGIQVRGNALIAAARILLPPPAIAGIDAGQLPVGEAVRLIDASTLQDRAAFDAYRRPRPAYVQYNTLCPYFGQDGDVVDAGIAYSARTGASLGWLSSGQYLAGRFQQGNRVWQVPDWRAMPTYVTFEPWNDDWLWSTAIPQSFPPTLQLATAGAVLASPALAHLSTLLRAFPDGDFTMSSFTDTGDDFVTTVDLARRGDTYRFVEPYGVDEPRRIVYANRSRWCTRTTTRALADTYAADLRARWRCTTGAKGWQQAQSLAARNLEARFTVLANELAPADAVLTLYGTELADAAAERIEWWPGAALAAGGKRIACSGGERPAACQFVDLDLTRQVAGMPRLSPSGRLVR